MTAGREAGHDGTVAYGAPARSVEGWMPTVSIVLPTLNERTYIRDCVDTLVGQDYPNVVEILVVDGGSADGTADVARRAGDSVRVVPNPGVTAAAAMNVGLDAATGEVIVRADAHTLYDPTYVTCCIRALVESGATVVGGRMRPVGTTSFGRAVAAVTSSRFGVGPGRFHYSEEPSDVETVYLGAYTRDDVLAVGGYDQESIQWAAEDQELNFRLRKAGGRIWLDPRIRSTYFPRSDPHGLGRQYFNYGLCKASTLKKHRTLPYWRPLAPAALVAGASAALVVGVARGSLRWAFAPTLAHAGACSAIALRLGAEPGVAPHRALLALMICHWSYGLGFLSGVWRILLKRPFDVRPRRGR